VSLETVKISEGMKNLHLSSIYTMIEST